MLKLYLSCRATWLPHRCVLEGKKCIYSLLSCVGFLVTSDSPSTLDTKVQSSLCYFDMVAILMPKVVTVLTKVLLTITFKYLRSN